MTRNIQLNNTSALEIKEFSLDSMAEHPAIVMIAKRASGKSWVCRSILKHFKNIPAGVIIAPTEKMANPPFYSDFFPDSYIHYAYKPELIDKILYRQDEMIAKQQKNPNVNPSAFILMDDCLASKGSWAKDAGIMELFFNGRHYRLMYILTMQFPLGITPELRGNFDYIFLLAEDIVSNKTRIYNHYAGMFPNFDSFNLVFSDLTKDFGAMVIVNRGARASLTDKVFWYKAKNEPLDELIGCKQFVNNHKLNYDENWRRKNKITPGAIIDQLGNKKQVKNIQVSKITKSDKSNKSHKSTRTHKSNKHDDTE